jgi:hypothetical protein
MLLKFSSKGRGGFWDSRNDEIGSEMNPFDEFGFEFIVLVGLRINELMFEELGINEFVFKAVWAFYKGGSHHENHLFIAHLVRISHSSNRLYTFWQLRTTEIMWHLFYEDSKF